ncbi:MAG: L,D-transpeptidase family protein [Betaproteobacteria bacterium]
MKIAAVKRIFAFWCFLIIPAFAFAAVITGGETVYRVVDGDSLLLISAKSGVDVATIARDNNLDRDRRLQPGQELKLNTRKITPKAVDNGIIIDIPGRMLYYFKAGKLEMSFPVGLGMRQWQGMTRWRTPAAAFTITGKERTPVWYVPQSIQWQMQVQGKPVLTRVSPGPDNPLGRFVLYTSIRGIAIHETIWPTTVYRFRSHGCIRVLSQNIEQFYNDVEVGTQGELVYEPVKAAVTDEGRVFFEVDPDVYGKAKNLMDEAIKLFDDLGVADQVNWDKVERIVRDQSGNAEDITAILEPLPDH